jgi:hypothetical protein
MVKGIVIGSLLAPIVGLALQLSAAGEADPLEGLTRAFPAGAG